MNTADVIVVGLGAMGSAAASALARRGVRVIGFDAFRPPHDNGSSHGETRVIREAYFEHPLYVPLVRQAYRCWRELEARSGRRLLTITGALLVGPPGSELVSGAAASAAEHGVPCEALDAAQIRARYPMFTFPAEIEGLFEPSAGALFPEACIDAYLAEAAAHGAELRFDEPLRRFRASDDRGGAEAITDRGVYAGRRLLLAAGAWVPALAPDPTLRVERQVLHWFAPREPHTFAAERFPVFLIEEADGALWYGVPDFGTGVKVAVHHSGAATTADGLDRAVHVNDVDRVCALLRQRMPAVEGAPTRSTVCMYTNTADGHFLVDELPDAPAVLVASACSGHGFKFASALGELLADRLTGTVEDDPLLRIFARDRSALAGTARSIANGAGPDRVHQQETSER